MSRVHQHHTPPHRKHWSLPNQHPHPSNTGHKPYPPLVSNTQDIPLQRNLPFQSQVILPSQFLPIQMPPPRPMRLSTLLNLNLPSSVFSCRLPILPSTDPGPSGGTTCWKQFGWSLSATCCFPMDSLRRTTSGTRLGRPSVWGGKSTIGNNGTTNSQNPPVRPIHFDHFRRPQFSSVNRYRDALTCLVSILLSLHTSPSTNTSTYRLSMTFGTTVQSSVMSFWRSSRRTPH